MGKAISFIFILFLGAVAYLAFFNREPVTLILTKNLNYEIPLIALLLISATAGALLLLIVYTIRDTKRLIDNIQTQKQQKKQGKIQTLYSRALSAIHGGKTAVASDALNDILAEDSRNVQATLLLGELHIQSKEYKKAHEVLKKALLSEPENVETLRNLAKVKELMGSYEEALGYIEDILEKNPTNLTAMHKKRQLLEKLGRWDDLVYLQKDLVKNAQSEKDKADEQELFIGYEYESGRESLEKGEIEKANKAFRTAVKLNEDFLPGHLGFAESMIREGSTEEAASYLEKIYEQSKAMIVLARLEDLILGLGEPLHLIRLYKSSLAETPSDNALKFFLAKLYYRLEMLDDALATINEMDNPSAFPDIAKIRGGIYLRRGQHEKAAEEFKAALHMKSTLRIPYCCSACGYKTGEWSGRCPSCGVWNSYYFNVYGSCSLKGE
jgi:tetratricopeptide (TPR) repeat protein